LLTLETSWLWAFGAVLVAIAAIAVAVLRRRQPLATSVGAGPDREAPVIISEYEGVEYTHRVLWKVVQDQARLAAEREREWFNPSLVAMVFAFHTVEAYVNFAGEQLAPAIWADEQNNFRDPRSARRLLPSTSASCGGGSCCRRGSTPGR